MWKRAAIVFLLYDGNNLFDDLAALGRVADDRSEFMLELPGDLPAGISLVMGQLRIWDSLAGLGETVMRPEERLLLLLLTRNHLALELFERVGHCITNAKPSILDRVKVRIP